MTSRTKKGNTSALEWFLSQVRANTGIVLTPDKLPLIEARLRTLMLAAKHTSLENYLSELYKSNSEENIQQAIDRMATHTTAFFREMPHFSLLERCLKHQNRDSVRIWSAAASTGEEAYSMAAVLDLAIKNKWVTTGMILGTDLKSEVVAHARAGIYHRDRTKDLHPKTIQSMFESTSEKDMLQIRSHLKSHVNFQVMNLTASRWGALPQFDIIFCRNVLFYFSPNIQKRVVHHLLDTLRPGGFIALGHADGQLAQKFPLRLLGPTFYQHLEVK